VPEKSTNAARASRSFDLPANAVWAALTDLDALAEWAPGIDGAAVISEAKGGVGAVRSVTTAQFGQIEHHVTAWEPDRLFAYVTADSGPFSRTNTVYELAPTDTGADVNVTLEFEVKPGAMTPEQAEAVLTKSLNATLQALELRARMHTSEA